MVVVSAASVEVVSVAPSPPKRLKRREMSTTRMSRPPIASAARTPAVDWTAGLGATGRAPWESLAPHSSQWRFDDGFDDPQEGQGISVRGKRTVTGESAGGPSSSENSSYSLGGAAPPLS